MLSQRATKMALQLGTPGKIVPTKDQYDFRSNPSGVISLVTAENQLMHPELAEFTSRVKIPPDAFTYAYSTLGGPQLQSALATHINETFNPFNEITATDIQVLSGATALHSVLAFSLAEPGDAILVSRPIYGRFEVDFRSEHGVRVIYADTPTENSLNPTLVNTFENALRGATKNGIKVRAVLISNPSNPLGRCYPRETLVEIIKFCNSYSLHFISDEIYALSVFGEHLVSDSKTKKLAPFTSVLSIDTTDLIDPRLVHVEYGTSKDFAAAGLRLGVLVTRNQHLQHVVSTVGRFHAPSGPSVSIGTAIFADRQWCRWFIDLSRRRIAKAYELVTSRLREIGVSYVEGNAGFFVFIDLGPWLPPADGSTRKEKESKLAQRLVSDGVLLLAGEEHALEPGRFRLVYTQSEEVAVESLRRLQKSLNRLPWQTEFRRSRL